MAPNKDVGKSSLAVDQVDDYYSDIKSIPTVNCQGFEDLQNETGNVRLFLFSGTSTSSLKEKLDSFLDIVKSAQSLQEVPRTLEFKENELFRHAILAESQERLISLLEAAITAPKYYEVNTAVNRLAFLIVSQGAQYPNMGSKLYAISPFFRKEFDECASYIEREYPDMKKFKHLITEENEAITEEGNNDPQTVLPYILVMEYVTFKMLTEQWGLSPDYVMGLSFGDYMSALMTGIISLKDLVTLIMTRCKLMTERIKEETFLIMGVSVAEYEQMLDEVKREPGMEDLWVEIACKNAPKQTCIVGKLELLERIYALCKSKGKKAMLKPHYLPYHSSMATPVLPDFEKVTSSVTYGKTGVKPQFISSLDGEIKESFDKNYYLDHLVKPMNFIDAFKNLLLNEKVTQILEIGPHPIYAPRTMEFISENMKEEEYKNYTLMTTFHRKQDDRVGFLNTAGRLFLCGYELNWNNILGDLEN